MIQRSPVRFLRQQIWSPPVPPFSFSPKLFKIPTEIEQFLPANEFQGPSDASCSEHSESRIKVFFPANHWLMNTESCFMRSDDRRKELLCHNHSPSQKVTCNRKLYVRKYSKIKGLTLSAWHLHIMNINLF